MKRLILIIFFGLHACGGSVVCGCSPPAKNCSAYGTMNQSIKYKVVNNSRGSIEIGDLFGGISSVCSSSSRTYGQQRTIQANNALEGELLDPYFGYLLDAVGRGGQAKAFHANPLLAIRLGTTTIAYNSGYPIDFLSELSATFLESQSWLSPPYYLPIPTSSSMDTYGLAYVLNNKGRALLGIPAKSPDVISLHTSLDAAKRAYKPENFTLIFTVNGTNKADVVITYQGDLQ